MTPEEIIEMPEYLNAAYEGDDLYTGDQVRKLMKLVAAAAASKEREACAKVCDEVGMFHEVCQGSDLCFDLSKAIRARGES